MKGHQELKPVQSLIPVEVDEEEFRKAAERAQGKLVAWVQTGVMGGSILQQTLDIGVVTTSNLGRITSSKGVSRKLIAVAEAAGYSQEICGYHKVAIGYALLLARGQLDLVPEVPTMPRPDFIWAPNGCQSNLWSSEALGRIFDVPVMGIDVPFEYDVEDRERMMDYVEGQLREALDILETWVGRPLDWPRLAEHIRGLAEVADIRNEVTQMCKTCRPSVSSAFYLEPFTWVHRTAPVEEGKRVYRALREEIRGKRERGERDVPEEKIRLVWHGLFPWAKRGALRELLARYGATLCIDQLSLGSPIERGEGLDPGNPLRTAAWLIEGTGANKSIDTRIEEWSKPSTEGYNVDGIIFNMARTCKIISIPALVWAAEAEKELGVSTLIVESDAIDPAFYDQNQVEDRIEAFLERIAGRKAEAREGLHKEVGG